LDGILGLEPRTEHPMAITRQLRSVLFEHAHQTGRREVGLRAAAFHTYGCLDVEDGASMFDGSV
jgi:hypothetical protein